MLQLQIYTNTHKFLGEGSGWIVDLVIEHNINILKYNPQLVAIISS